MSLLEEMEQDIEKGEGQEIEFMEIFPENASELAKEIAAFASTNPGTIYLGISDDGEKFGIEKNGKGIKKLKDEFQNRIAGISQKTVKPAIQVRVEFIEEEDKLFVKITVPKGKEPVYYVNNVPYIRVLTLSQPASWDQVKESHRLYFQKQGILIRKAPEHQIFFNVLMQLSDFELLWTDHMNRQINPDFEQLMYDINTTGESLIKFSFEKTIQDEHLDEELKKSGEMMGGLAHHRFFMDGGKSYKAFEEKGNEISKNVKYLIPRVQKRMVISREDFEEINDSLRKNIKEIKNYWEQRERFLERGEIDLLKEHMRRISYSFNRISNIPAQHKEQKFAAELKAIAIKLRELSSVKYFMKGIGINPIDKIKDEMEKIIIELDKISTLL